MTLDDRRLHLGLPRGMRDRFPDDLAARAAVLSKMVRRFELFGFVPLDTPALERLEVLTGKYGEEGEKLGYRVMKRGAELEQALAKVKAGQAGAAELADLGLRYDLTVPLARVVASAGERLPKPFKRYQVGPVWRADRPQHGRYREFVQCDVDIVGTDSPVADAELVCLMLEVFADLGLSEVQIHLNHREVLAALSSACGNAPEHFGGFCAALDKLDKVGREGVKTDMLRRGLGTARLSELWDVAGDSPALAEGEALERWRRKFMQFVGEAPGTPAWGKLEAVLRAVQGLGADAERVRVNPALARGLDYYTGAVFEAVSPDADIGSLGGGGRYDGLIEQMSGKSIPATGTSFGLERIVDVLGAAGRLDEPRRRGAVAAVLVGGGADEDLRRGAAVAGLLRRAGVPCQVGYQPGARWGKQIQEAVRAGCDFVVLVGADAAGSADPGRLVIKRLSDGVQKTLTLEEAADWINSRR